MTGAKYMYKMMNNINKTEGNKYMLGLININNDLPEKENEGMKIQDETKTYGYNDNTKTFF